MDGVREVNSVLGSIEEAGAASAAAAAAGAIATPGARAGAGMGPVSKPGPGAGRNVAEIGNGRPYGSSGAGSISGPGALAELIGVMAEL